MLQGEGGKKFIQRIWFMQLWRLRTLKICSQQDGDLGESMCTFSPNQKSQDPEKPMV